MKKCKQKAADEGDRLKGKYTNDINKTNDRKTRVKATGTLKKKSRNEPAMNVKIKSQMNETLTHDTRETNKGTNETDK